MPELNQFSLKLKPSLQLQLGLGDEAAPLASLRPVLLSGEANLLDAIPEAVHISQPDIIVSDLGKALRTTASGIFRTRGGSIHQTISVDRYPQWPEAFILQWRFENVGATSIQINRLDCPLLCWEIPFGEKLWTFQGAAVNWGHDFAFQLPARFERDNYLGHVDYGEGGGIPLVYLWNASLGLAMAHVEPLPKDWYMPVQAAPGEGVCMRLQNRQQIALQPGEALTGLRTLISLHKGDFFSPITLYRAILAAQGVRAAEPNSEDYEPAWCSWGFEFDVRPEDIVGALPKVGELGFRWLTLDDGWFDNYGDWNPRPATFPGGEEQMRRMVDEIHRAGKYAQIWWYPLSVEDGVGEYAGRAYGTSEILYQHSDWLIHNQDGSLARNNRGLAILDPSLPAVRAYIEALTRRFIQDWDFDGHKLDNVYTVPACYNPAHHHRRPEESVDGLSGVYRIIFETTRSLKPYSVTQICPCGTTPTFSLLPYMDQSVTADPTSSAQVRQRVKFYKALLGPASAVFADHVELSDGGLDFASQVGTGGVPATKFVWPPDISIRSRLGEGWWGLTPEKQALIQNWLFIFHTYRLAEGEYLNLYDLGFDLPEAHAIRKDGRLYYAFYTPRMGQAYSGEVELRGLEQATYRLRDYFREQELGSVQGPVAVLDVNFEGALLIEATRGG